MYKFFLYRPQATYRHIIPGGLKEAMPNLSDLLWEAEKMVLTGHAPSDYEALLAKAKEVNAQAAEVALGLPKGPLRDNALSIKQAAERIVKGAEKHLRL